MILITKSNWGGAQRYVYDLATNLPTDTYEVVVALGGTGALIQKLQDAHIRVINIPGLQRNISFKKEILSFWKIAHLLRDEDPDVLHVNSSKAGGIGAFLGRTLGVPRVIYTAHGWAFNEDRGLLSRLVVGFFHWLTILLAHHTITVSDALKNQMRWPNTAKKMTTIRNGRPLPTYVDREKARITLTEQIPVLTPFTEAVWSLTIGELHPIKRHDVIIDAIAHVVHSGYAIRHIIIGDGELRDVLQDQIDAAEMSTHIFLAGSMLEAAQYLKAADMFVLASDSEALGYVVLEAAQAKLPIVASNVGGIPEIVSAEKSAQLVPAGDVAAFAAAITTYLDQPDLARQYAHAAQIQSLGFTIETMVQETTAVYQTTQ